MTQRVIFAMFLGIVLLAASCNRGGSEPEARENAPATTSSPTTVATNTVAATATAANDSGLPDPFEMTAPPPPPDPNGPCVLGTKLAADGNVGGAEVSFAKGDSIYVTVRPKQSMKELTIEIVDHMGKRLQTFSEPLKSNAVTHPLNALPHGRYRVIAHGGMDESVCELAFEVR